VVQPQENEFEREEVEIDKLNISERYNNMNNISLMPKLSENESKNYNNESTERSRQSLDEKLPESSNDQGTSILFNISL